MASITEFIKNIRNARLGKDVRESIASAIEQTYEDATEKGSSNMEVAQARGAFNTLRERLNNSDSVKADKEEVTTLIQTEGTARESADSNLQIQINGLASGSPLVASSISGMTDITRVYVNTTDGHWYYYNGTNWVQGGIYQATVYNDVITTYTIPLDITGFIKASDGLLNTSNGYKSSNFIEVNSNQYITGRLYQIRDVIGLVAFYDKDKHYLSSYWGEDSALSGFINVEQSIPENCKYIRVSTREENGYNAFVNLNVVDYINKVENDIEQKTPISIDTIGYLRPNGTVSSTNGFGVSDFIEIQYGEVIKGKLKQASQNISLVCFYDENKNLISSYLGDGTEETKFIDIELKVPLNAKYVRVSTTADVIGYYANIIANSKKWLTTINGLIDETRGEYYVDKTATPSGNIFNSLISCLKYVMSKNYSYPVNIYVKGGTYNIYEELGGIDFLSSITSSDTPYTIDQPWLYNINLIGLGNVVLEYKPAVEDVSQYPLGEGLIAPLNIRGNVNIENITIECQYCRYAIHDETGGISKYYNTYHNYKNVNCHMITKSASSSGGHTIGLGFDNGQRYNFENCKLTNNNNITSTNAPLFIHNRESYGGNFTINNCIFETVGSSSLLLSNVGNQEKTNVNISNSNFNKQIFLRSENNQDVINCFQIYMNNCNNIDVGVSAQVISNPYNPIIKNII